jgi:hypothetical protein
MIHEEITGINHADSHPTHHRRDAAARAEAAANPGLILLAVSLGRSVEVQGLVDPAALSFCMMSPPDRPRACPILPRKGDTR